ncbi:hypothetical protein MXD81_27975 [Microbacteriaceae bacterium K1510]|nr:hypothetical protein [Microbacteriaceae bacterium K1510]
MYIRDGLTAVFDHCVVNSSTVRADEITKLAAQRTAMIRLTHFISIIMARPLMSSDMAFIGPGGVDTVKAVAGRNAALPTNSAIGSIYKQERACSAVVRAPCVRPGGGQKATGRWPAPGHMIGTRTMSKLMGAVALTMALAVPTMAFAAQGYRARAQAPARYDSMSTDNTRMSPERVQALKDCTAVEQKMGSQSTWGVQQLDVYRACMTEHGQAE